METHLETLKSFNQAISNKNLNDNDKLQINKATIGEKHEITAINSSKRDLEANNAIRRSLVLALTGSFSVKTLEELPASVRKALKIEDFGIKNGEVTSTRPLTARRIRAVMSAIQEATAKAASNQNEANAIRDDFNKYLQDSKYMQAAFDRIAIAEGRKPLSLNIPLISENGFDIPLSALKVYTKGIKPTDLAGKLDEIKNKIENDVISAIDTLAHIKSGESIKPDANAANALRHYFALCAYAANMPENSISRTISIPDEGGKIAAFLNASAGKSKGSELEAVHTPTNPHLKGSYDVTRLTIDIGIDKSSNLAEPSHGLYKAYENLALKKGFSPLMRREANSTMSIAQMHANINAEFIRLQNEYLTVIDLLGKQYPDAIDSNKPADLNKIPEPFKTNINKILDLRQELNLFISDLSLSNEIYNNNPAVRYAGETILTKDQIPAYGSVNVIEKANTKTVQNEEELYKNLTVDDVINDIKQFADSDRPTEKNKQQYAVARLLEVLPKAILESNKDALKFTKDSKNEALFDKAKEFLASLGKRELFIVRACALCFPQANQGMLTGFGYIPEDRTIIYDDLKNGVIPLNTSIPLLRAIVYHAHAMINIHTAKQTGGGIKHLYGPHYETKIDSKQVKVPVGICTMAIDGSKLPTELDKNFKNDFLVDGESYVVNTIRDVKNREALIKEVFMTRAFGFNTLEGLEIVNFIKSCGYDPTTITNDDVHKLMILARINDFKLDDIPGFCSRVLNKDIKDVNIDDLNKLYELFKNNKIIDPINTVKSKRAKELIGIFTGGQIPSKTGLSGNDMLKVVNTLRDFAADGGEKEATLKLNGKTVKIQQNIYGALQFTIDGLKISGKQNAASFVNIFEGDMVSNIDHFGTDVILNMIPELTMDDIADRPDGNTNLRNLCLRIVAERLQIPQSSFATISTKQLRTIAADALKGYFTTETGVTNKDVANAILSANIRNDVFTGEEIRDIYGAMKRMDIEELNNKVVMGNQAEKPSAAKKQPRLTLPEKQAKVRELIADLIINKDIISYDEAVRNNKGAERILNLIKNNAEIFADILIDPKGMLGGLSSMISEDLIAKFEEMTQNLPKVEGNDFAATLKRNALRSVYKEIFTMLPDIYAVPAENRLQAIEEAIKTKPIIQVAIKSGVANNDEIISSIMTVLPMISELDEGIDGIAKTAMDQIQNTINSNLGKVKPQAKDNKEVKEQTEIWKQSFDKLVGGALTDTDSGYGKFMFEVLSSYFSGATPQEARQIMAAVFRYTDQNSTPGQILGAIFKGAGPLLQKMLQALPSNAFGEEMVDALKDMKSNLQPIPEEIVQAHLLNIVERSNGAIKAIKLNRSLGAASVGQAFLCTIITADNPKGEECVIKILRPNIKTIIEKEKLRFMEAAKNVPGMDKTFEGQYSRILDELDFTKEMTNVNYGRNVYEEPILYVSEGLINSTTKKVVRKTVHSMEVHPLVPPTMDCLILKKAPGETYDRFMSNARKEAQALTNGINPPEKVEYSNSAELKVARDKLILLYNDVKKRQEHLLHLAEKWVHEALYGNGFYHGDLHAGNLMTDKDVGLTVIDFGNATHLTEDERGHVLKMMAAAMFGREKFFEASFLSLISDKYRDAYNKANANGELTNQLHEILNKGTTKQAGQRIFAALLFLQQKEIEIPGPIFNFAQCQMRLGGAVDEINSLLYDIEDRLANLKLKPIDNNVPIPDMGIKGMSSNVCGLFIALRNYLDPTEESGGAKTASKVLEIIVGPPPPSENVPATLPALLNEFEEVCTNREAFDAYLLPIIERFTNTQSCRYISMTQQFATIDEGGDLRNALAEFLKAREGNDDEITKATASILGKMFIKTIRSFMQPLADSRPKKSESPDPNDFVYAIAGVVTGNIKPALKTLGTMAVPIAHDMYESIKEENLRFERQEKTGTHIHNYNVQIANGALKKGVVEELKEIADKFQHPLQMPGMDGKYKSLKSAENRAILLSTLRFNLDLLEKELTNRGLLTENTTPDTKMHFTRIAIQIFADRIGGIADAVKNLPKALFSQLYNEAYQSETNNNLSVCDALVHLHYPLETIPEEK